MRIDVCPVCGKTILAGALNHNCQSSTQRSRSNTKPPLREQRSSRPLDAVERLVFRKGELIPGRESLTPGY